SAVSTRRSKGPFSRRTGRNYVAVRRENPPPITQMRRVTLVRAVLLDVDGTLVDSNDAHAMAWVEAFEAAGRAAPFEQVRRLIGKGGDKLLPEVTGLQDESPEGKTISRQRAQIF